MTLLPGCQDEGENSGESLGERTGVEPQTERGQQAGQDQRAMNLEPKTLPVESCHAQSQEHQAEVPHRKVLLVRDIKLN